MKKIKLFFACAAMTFFSLGQVWADEISFTSTTCTNWTTSQAAQSQTIDGITLSTTSGMKDASNGHLRLYASNTHTITSTVGNITKIVITCTAQGTNNYGPGKLSGTGYTASSGYTGTWEGNATEVTLTGGQARATSIVVTYTAAAPTKCAAPTFSPESKTFFSNNISVELSSTTTGSTIYYTLDGSTPTTSSTEYTAAIPVSSTTTIKAIATRSDLDDSDQSTATYTKGTPVSGYDIDFEANDVEAYTDWNFSNIACATTISAHGGTYYGNNNAQLTASITTKEKIALPGSLTFYISKESTNSNASSWIVKISEDGSAWTNVQTFDAKSMDKAAWISCVADLHTYSDVYVRIAYEGNNAIRTIDDISLEMRAAALVEAPNITGVTPFLRSTTATLTCVTTGASIWYTLDGSEPDIYDINTECYTSPIPLTTTTTVKAIAFKDDNVSEVATKVFTQATILTVAEALEIIDGLNNGATTPDYYYIAGKVSTAGSYLNSGKLTYSISDDGSTTNEVKVYSGKYLDNADFTSVDQLALGDNVVIYGRLQKYQDSQNNIVPEIASGNYVAEHTGKGEITNIVLSGAPLQSEYEAGDAFLFDGLTATAIYQNGTEEDVTATAEWSADPATIFSNVDVSVVASVGSISSSPELVPVTVKTHHVSFNSPQGGSLVVKCGGTPISDGDDFVKGTVLTVEATPAEGYNLQSLICTGATLEDGQLTVGTEEIEITATFVAKAEPDLSWSASTATATIGATNSFPTLNNPHGLTVSYESTNESVATIDIEYGVLTVTLISAGQTTIKAVFPGDNEYVSGSAEYLLTVEEPSTYTLTLHIQAMPNDGTPEADLFTAVTFDVFDNDDDPDHEFVKYDNSSNLVMSGTFTAGKVVNFENFSSEAYNFANWENDETQYYRGVTMNSDMEITMYVIKNVWTATIGVHDLNKGMVEIISAEPLYWADINDPSSTWRLRISATAIPGYKFLGWGEVDLEENLMNWYNAASLEEHFANLQAEYEEMVAMGESLTDPDGIAWRDLLGQRLSANAEFTAQQVYSYEEFEFNDPIGSYSLMAFFTEDTSTGCENVNADGVEAYKRLENGQLVIIKNGVRYNALGELMK